MWHSALLYVAFFVWLAVWQLVKFFGLLHIGRVAFGTDGTIARRRRVQAIQLVSHRRVHQVGQASGILQFTIIQLFLLNPTPDLRFEWKKSLSRSCV